MFCMVVASIEGAYVTKLPRTNHAVTSIEIMSSTAGISATIRDGDHFIGSKLMGSILGQTVAAVEIEQNPEFTLRRLPLPIIPGRTTPFIRPRPQSCPPTSC